VTLRRILLLLVLGPALLVAVAWYWLLHTESGARWLWARAEAVTDGALTAVGIRGDITSGVELQGIAFENDAVELVVDDVSLVARLELLPLRVVVERGNSSGFSLRILERDSDRADGTDLGVIFAKLQLPFELAIVQLDMRDAVFEGFAAGRFISFDAATISGSWQDAFRIERLRATTPYYDVDGGGRLALSGGNAIQADVTIDAKPALTGLAGTVSFDADVTGSIDDLRLRAEVADPEATVIGRLAGLGGELAWEVDAEAPAFSLPVDGELAELPPLSLSATAQGDTRALTAEADVGVIGTQMQVGIAADVDIQSGAISSDLDWQDAHWPLGEQDPRVASRRGRVTVGGSLDDWSVAGTLDLDVQDLPPGRFTIDGGGNRDGAAVKIIEGNILGGTIRGQGEYSWRQPGAFAANLEMQGIRTEGVLPDWPAELNGSVELTGQQQPLRVAALLNNVNGHFRDRPLHADGHIEYGEAAVSVANLDLRHGDAKARLDGQLYAVEGLSFDILVDDLALYVDGAFGEVVASGVVSLRPGGEFLRIDAASDRLGYRDFAVEAFRITDGDDEDSVVNIEAAAASMNYGNLQAEQLRVVPYIGREAQSLDLGVVTNGLQVVLSIQGALDDWQRTSTWRGEVARLDVRHEEFDATLQESAAITLSTQRAAVEKLCMSGGRGIGLCVDGSWASGTGSDLDARLSAVPVDLVNAFVETRLEFDQVVSGSFAWRAGPDGKSDGRADLRMTAGTVVSIDDTDRRLTTGESRLGFDVDGDDLHGGIIDLPLPGQGQIAAEFQVLDVANTGSADLDGSIDIDLADIGIILPFVPVLDHAGGALRADIDVDGTPDAPLITGTVALENGSLTYLPIGLRLDEIEVESELQGRGDIEVMGSFRAGEGRGQIRTRADQVRSATGGIEVTLRGHNLTLIDVPDVKAIANTDVRVRFNGEELDIDGTLTIARARIVPSNIGTSRVYESEDVVIVAGDLPDDPAEAAGPADVRIFGDLQVSLGENVIVDLGVVETSVSGSTLLAWNGDPIPMANGQFGVEGEILVFGQRLEITEGAVQFPDVPADDPYLRIRAEREIFGNTQVRRAGVLVAGSISRPTIEAYTTPVTTEERALTLLVTGSDFDYERGIGALDFGTYIAPRVYASYGIGLFDNENVIRIRYDLQRGFGITLTSGQKESGADLSYRFEN
jgi:translocation and assembly module TamB